MTTDTGIPEISELNQADTSQPVRIGPGIWWVGSVLEGDPFQCHAYLIDQGDQSILIDPGSHLTFEKTLEKIEKVMPFSRIRYFLCHHQDPDITSALPEIDARLTRDDAMVVSHWRANALLKHYGLRTLKLMCVEEAGWILDLGNRILRFIFTPYLHFPGAFCTFDATSGIFFSSDLFGGFTESWSLVAQDESYFEAMRPFHEHYMPHRDLLVHGLSKMDDLPIEMIAPQHGSLIPSHLVRFMINRLKETDCGLFLMTRTNSDFQRLSSLNRMLRGVMETMVLHREFKQVAQSILDSTAPLIPADSLEFFAVLEDGKVLHLAPETGFRGAQESPPPECRAFLGLSRDHWKKSGESPYLVIDFGPGWEGLGLSRFNKGLILPLFSSGGDKVRAVVVFRLTKEVAIDDELAHALTQISIPLGVAVEREVLLQALEKERQRLYETSIRDALTGLYTRIYMRDTAERLCRVHDRDPDARVAVVMLDIDHFKSVNDTYGHDAGDVVLKAVAQALMNGIRGVDVPVRLGGEEFLLFLVGAPEETVLDIVDRIRRTVGELSFPGAMAERQVTISAGIAFRSQKESFEAATKRADLALYEAKESGRNKLVVSKEG